MLVLGVLKRSGKIGVDNFLSWLATVFSSQTWDIHEAALKAKAYPLSALRDVTDVRLVSV